MRAELQTASQSKQEEEEEEENKKSVVEPRWARRQTSKTQV